MSATEATPDGTKQMATAMEERRRRPTELASEIGVRTTATTRTASFGAGLTDIGRAALPTKAILLPGKAILNRCGTKVRIVGAPLVETARTKSKVYGEE